MSLRLYASSAVVCVGLALAVAWIFEMPLERAAVLAPVIVVVAGAAAALVVLWTRVGWESLRQARHPRRIVALAVAGVALIVVLTLIGIQLPRE